MSKVTVQSVSSRLGRSSKSDGGGTALEVRFGQHSARLNASRRNLISKILSESQENYFLSSRELGKRYGVDSATIVRTVQALGYKRFADFAGDLRNHFVTQITPYSALRAAANKRKSVEYYISESIDTDLRNLNRLRDEIDVAKVARIAAQIHKSRRIVVVGLDFAASLASSMSYGLVRLGCDSEAPIGTEGVIHSKVKLLTPNDLLICISFGKCLRTTVEAARTASRIGVPTFGLTDSDRTPIARYCDDYVIASIERTSFLDSYVASVAAINAILVACAHSKTKKALALLSESEKEDMNGTRWFND